MTVWLYSSKESIFSGILCSCRSPIESSELYQYGIFNWTTVLNLNLYLSLSSKEKPLVHLNFGNLKLVNLLTEIAFSVLNFRALDAWTSQFSHSETRHFHEYDHHSSQCCCNWGLHMCLATCLKLKMLLSGNNCPNWASCFSRSFEVICWLSLVQFHLRLTNTCNVFHGF